ncbi:MULTISPECIES: hypothetical protein [Vibrio]|uniref:Uncharacterized protein n=2 Tax=Vibrio TaxID=662 RepID=A0A7X4LLH8_9VIBR|nr:MULTISPECIES: hypothetical protein [Vibrio]MBF9000292.1 hypothetical protein [Vibrio nitrifigilis]MZI94168.1 hypothetical protein [Vibrio eleionomae]
MSFTLSHRIVVILCTLFALATGGQSIAAVLGTYDTATHSAMAFSSHNTILMSKPASAMHSPRMKMATASHHDACANQCAEQHKAMSDHCDHSMSQQCGSSSCGHVVGALFVHTFSVIERLTTHVASLTVHKAQQGYPSSLYRPPIV